MSNYSPIKIYVAYGWHANGPRNDPRWNGLRPFLESIVADATGRQANAAKANPEARCLKPWIQGPDRLRARPGDFLFRSIFERIEQADILLADISHRERAGQSERVANVLVEVGAALANKRTRVFLIEDKHESKPLLDGLSDLSGFYVSQIEAKDDAEPEDRLKALNKDPSLRTAILGAITGLMRERGMWPENTPTDDEPKGEGPKQKPPPKRR